MAVLSNKPDVVLVLLEYNADLNVTDSEGNTPLMLARENNFNEVVKAIINSN